MSRCSAYYHQGGHGGAPPLEMMNKWFTRYLYGVENGVEREPKAWIVRESHAGATTAAPAERQPAARGGRQRPAADAVRRLSQSGSEAGHAATRSRAAAASVA